jgi:MSHA biogenesis protein MshQ
MKKTVICLLFSCASAMAAAATYTMAGGSQPACSNGAWSLSGSTYTCSGSTSLASGDSILSGSGITLVANGGITLAGGNTIGSASVPVNLQTTYGDLISSGSGTVIYGNLAAGSGLISLTSTTVNGGLATNGNISLSGGSVSGNVSGRNGVTTTNGTTVGGSLTATNGAVSLSGGSVGGLVTGSCCGVTTNNTNLGSGVSSSNNTVNITGGTIAGPISSSGGSGVVISNATMTSGSISTTSVSISISNSTIGSPSSTVNVSSNNSVTLANNTTVYGNVTADTHASALSIDSTSVVYGICQSNSNSNSNPAQYPRCAAALIAEWRMDESAWAGSVAEVKDSVGSAHGKAAIASGSGPLATTAAGTSAYTNGSQSTCRYGYFDNSSSSPRREYTYVELGSFPSLPAQFTFAGWVRTTDRTVSGQRILVNDDNQNGWALSLGDNGAGTLRFFNRNLRRDGNVTNAGSNSACGTTSGDPFCLDTDAVIANNTWYFVAVSVNNSSKRISLYVFDQSGGVLARPNSAYTNNWTNGSGTIAIGGETKDSGEGTQSSFHFRGNIDELKVYGGAISETVLKNELTRVRSCTGAIDHIRILHDGEGLTCSPETVTVQACANVNCTSLYLGSVGVTLQPGGDSFTFTGGQMTTATVRRPTLGTATLDAPSVSPGVFSVARCFNGTTETCSMNFVDSGFVFDIPDHSAETTQTVTLKAVKKTNSSTICTPAFVSQNKTLNFKCLYANPTTGSLPVRISGTALNTSNSAGAACDSSGKDISLTFNAAGEASLDVLYADVGQMTVSANYTGASGGAEAGLVMTGTDNFIAAPKEFVFTSITASPIKAGSAFSANVMARNALGATAKNFGKETVPETVELKSVTATTASAANSQLVGPANGATGKITNGTKGVFAACNPLVDGTVCATQLAWTEVGDVTLSAARAASGYLGSTIMPFGTTNARFIPSFFETEFVGLTPTTQACGTFTYSGQPFRVRVTAKSEANASLGSSIATTLNYRGSYARDVTLGADDTSANANASCVPATSGFANRDLAATVFSNGVGESAPVTNTVNPLPITYTQTLLQPRSVSVCAKDTDGVAAHGTQQAKAVLAIRNGRLRLFNAFGSARLPLDMPVQTQYWSGSTWIQNSADSCTSLVAGNFFLFPNGLSSVVQPVTISGGSGVIRLAAPAGGATATVDIAANLGTAGNDQSCLGNHGGNPGSLPWLRARNGDNANCVGGPSDRDPSARASFGIYTPESTRVIHMREFF